MDLTKGLFILVITMIFVALANLAITFTKVSDIRQEVTGMATGYVNITVNTQVNIAVNNDTIWWGPGVVNSTWEGEDNYNAELTTHGEGSPTVTGGNWTSTDESHAYAIQVQNIGNVNCSLKLYSDKDASDLFNSLSGTNQSFQWNVSQKESSSCSAGTEPLGVFRDVNKSAANEAMFCGQFDSNPARDEVFIDTYLMVPNDAQNTNSQEVATITITGDTAGG